MLDIKYYLVAEQNSLSEYYDINYYTLYYNPVVPNILIAQT